MTQRTVVTMEQLKEVWFHADAIAFGIDLERRVKWCMLENGEAFEAPLPAES